jgi:hypothetical protein
MPMSRGTSTQTLSSRPLWLNLAPNLIMSEAIAQDALACLWTAF